MQHIKKPSIAIITFLCPYPVSDGGRFGVFSFVNDIRELFNVTLIFKVPDSERANVMALEKLWPEVNIQPFYTNSSIKTNVHQKKLSLYKKLVQPIRKAKYAKRAKNNADNKPIAHGLYPFVPIERAFVDFLGQLFSRKKFDVVQIEYSDLLSLVHLIPGDTKKVFFQHENRYAILEDYFEVNRDKGAYASYIVDTARFTEINLMNQYDRILLLNKKDRERLSKYIPEYKLQLMPTSVPQSLIPRCTLAKIATRIVFMGSQNHYPNVDGVQWFAKEMLDGVRKETGLKLFVTGTWTDAFKFQHSELNFTGFVDDIAEVLQSGILVAPIRLGGGGIRIKLLQAMACGIPVVATSLITDGMEGIEHGYNIFIADTAEEFINSIAILANDSSLYTTISKNARKTIQTYYAAETAIKIKEKIFGSLLREHFQDAIV